MADAMDVDTVDFSPHTPKPDVVTPVNPDHIVDAAFALLRTHLYNFIIRQLTVSVGEEFLSDVAPPPQSSLLHLLRFVLDKWISTFADSKLRHHKPTIERFIALVKSVCPTDVVLVTSSTTAKEALQIAECLLIDFHPAASARVSALGRALHSNSSCTPVHINPKPVATVNVSQKSTPQQQFPAVTPVQHLSQHLANRILPVILDGSNIAWRHGQSKFSIRGVVLALHYFSERNHPVVLFLPEARLRNTSQDSEYALVKSLRGTPNLVLTPDDDYDDAYICHFARANCALIVSNDAFKDHVYQASAVSEQAAKEWKTWFSACRVSFTFRGDQFLPNPAFNYDRAVQVAMRLVVPL
ncbi:unnamed protein product [Agarophyton chilense]